MSAKPANYEEAITRLTEIVKDIESGELGLANSMELMKEAEGLIKYCQKQLESADEQLSLFVKNTSTEA